MSKKYNQYSDHLKQTFGCKVYKVTLDAGFDCPNRDGSISAGGCIFCDEGGSFSRAHCNTLSIENQLCESIERLKKRYKAQKFISYFQAFSNTYGNVEHLKNVYDQALNNDEVAGLSIGTRPDCVDEEKIDLITSYAKDNYVWVEYGLQSMHDRTLQFINRGHDYKCFEDAVKLTQGRGIKICAHVILGLPGETKEDMLLTAKALAGLGIDGVKIHQLCALKGTKLEQMYKKGEFVPMEIDEYVSTVCDFIELLSPSTTIHRLAGNGLNELLIAPSWLPEKFKVLNMIDREFERRGSFQGMRYGF